MKTYLSTGIGDMMSLDCLLTQEEKESITELYWACRWGKILAPLLANNPDYPNLKEQYFIDDEVGINITKQFKPGIVECWHFRPDFEPDFQIGLDLFGLSRDEVNVIDAVAILKDPNREFNKSSFLYADESIIDWNQLGIDPNEYILIHYPTSTRRNRIDMAKFGDKDWDFVTELEKDTGHKVVVISDTELPDLPDSWAICVNWDIHKVTALCKFASHYVGCDSFVSLLTCKVLPPGS